MKKQTISNAEILSKLIAAGLVPETRYSKRIDTTKWDYRTHQYKKYQGYRIPLDVYNKVIGKRFTTKFKRGVTVRFTDSTTRSNTRRSIGQDIGDIYTWGHLGIGSGKNYIDFDELEDPNTPKWRRNLKLKNNFLTIGNEYIVNPYSANNLSKHYNDLGYKIKGERSYWTQTITPQHFYEYAKLEGDGLLGPKKLINGTITQVYVHFIYPKWEFKREARYEVLFDTGAKGIFTGDRLMRVFDTDFDLDEKMCFCNETNCKCNQGCSHKGLHIGTDECKETCQHKLSQKCIVVYDYSQLCETTIQRGLIEDEEEGNSGN